MVQNETLTITGSTISNNETAAGYTSGYVVGNGNGGGAILSLYSKLAISGTTISYNYAGYAGAPQPTPAGGAIAALYSAVTVDGLTMNHNGADYGGAIAGIASTITVSGSSLKATMMPITAAAHSGKGLLGHYRE